MCSPNNMNIWITWNTSLALKMLKILPVFAEWSFFYTICAQLTFWFRLQFAGWRLSSLLNCALMLSCKRDILQFSIENLSRKKSSNLHMYTNLQKLNLKYQNHFKNHLKSLNNLIQLKNFFLLFWWLFHEKRISDI